MMKEKKGTLIQYNKVIQREYGEYVNHDKDLIRGTDGKDYIYSSTVFEIAVYKKRALKEIEKETGWE